MGIAEHKSDQHHRGEIRDRSLLSGPLLTLRKAKGGKASVVRFIDW